MPRFLALVEHDGDAYGAYFPQLPGCTAMGDTLDEAVANATQALAEFVNDGVAAGRAYRAQSLAEFQADEDVRTAISSGAVPIYVPLLRGSGRTVRANVSLHSELLDDIDDAAKRSGLTRSSWLASAAREALKSGA